MGLRPRLYACAVSRHSTGRIPLPMLPALSAGLRFNSIRYFWVTLILPTPVNASSNTAISSIDRLLVAEKTMTCLESRRSNRASPVIQIFGISLTFNRETNLLASSAAAGSAIHSRKISRWRCSNPFSKAKKDGQTRCFRGLPNRHPGPPARDPMGSG